MKCPPCQVELKMAERQGVEIDYCPQCRGVWLDRGELDKIIERSEQLAGPQDRPVASPDRVRDDRYDRDRDDRYDRREDYYKKRKRGGFFGDLFDFD
jgi:uncharacterized protein